MGVLNITPDSFFDGGQFLDIYAALVQAKKMVEAGAAIIDVGGESTRPGASIISVEEEINRVVPIIEAIKSEIIVPISIDTSKPKVMHASVKAGAGMINDVRALCVPGALRTVKDLDVPVCLMHTQGNYVNVQDNPQYEDVTKDVCKFLIGRVDTCARVGISYDKIILDPGFGFGKQVNHNLQLMKCLHAIVNQGFPVLVGVSRKSIIGSLLDLTVDERLSGSLSLATIAVWQGAKIIRCHDVRETVEAISICNHVMQVEDFD
ncbi:MAG: dihydropteroate synthase [Piscirickettsiaceae bacterium]|nr:dihydropteroate synthase [Piscirickettsiaceae bacterium]